MRSSTDQIREKINNSQGNQDQHSTLFQPLVIDDHYVTKQPSKPFRQSDQDTREVAKERVPPPLNQSMISSFFIMNGNKIPIKHRPTTDYVIIGENSTKSFHKVDKIKKAITKKLFNFTRFFKHNPMNSLMSELEAVCCAFFRLIAPNYAPTGRAHIDAAGNYVGFSSKEMPGFKSLKEDELCEEDLEIKCLDKGWFTIPELEDIDAKVARDRKAALLRYDKEKNPEDLDRYDLDKMHEKKLDDQVLWYHPSDNKKFVTVKDLRNYRIVKGLAIGLITSFILGEDDCHRGNISKYGVRIDFDMALWWLLCQFKKGSLIDWTFRFPDGSTFAVTADDILHFPNLIHADPFYWPAKHKNFFTSRLAKVLLDTALAKKLSTSTNGYRAKDYAVFEKLEKHPVFIYHKNATLLKFILSEANMYRNQAKLHIREQVIIEEKLIPILDILTQTMNSRINEFKNVLMDMPQFYEFFNIVDKPSNKKYGEIICNHIKAEFAEYNDKCQKKENPEYKDQLMSKDRIQQNHDAFFKAAKSIHDKVYIDPLVEEFSMLNEEPIVVSSLDPKVPIIKT